MANVLFGGSRDLGTEAEGDGGLPTRGVTVITDTYPRALQKHFCQREDCSHGAHGQKNH